MPAVMRAANVCERAGVPAVAIGATGFDAMGRVIARSMGIGHVPIAVYPGVILTDDTKTFDEKVVGTVVPQVIDALTGRLDGDRTDSNTDGRTVEPSRTEVVYAGDLDAIQEKFLAEQWSDGLPVIPPTVERVEAMLRFSTRDPDEVIGILYPERREATVWNVAVNGVMAGCRPEYFPLLLAIVECLSDPEFRVQDAGATPGWEPLVVLSGPAAKRLDFNSGTGVMRVGRQANTSVGRFVRVYLRNVAGLRIPPGHTDQGAISYSFNVVLAEDDEAITEIGWPSYRVDAGYGAGESVVTVQSVVNISAPIYSGGDTADDHLKTISELVSNAMGPWTALGIANAAWHPLLVVGPSIAQALASRDVGKPEIRQYLYDHAQVRAEQLERYAWQTGMTSFDLVELARAGKADPIYARSDDPERLVPMFVNPDWIGIVVAGNPHRNQSRAYIGNHAQGVPVSRVIEEPW
jgi:hypothetical protein